MERSQQQYYREAIDLSLPRIYHTVDYNLLDLIHSVIDNHPIHRTFFPKFHWDVAFYLLTILITMCFLSAVIFDHFVFFFGQQFSCGHRTSVFDCASSKDDISCFWDASRLLCTSKYSDVDADNIIWIALFLTLLSIPVIHYLSFCNLYFIKLVTGSSDEINKSKIVIVSDRTMSNPHSSSNRKISFEKNLLSSILHQEYNLFCGRLGKDLPSHPIFASVWVKILIASSILPLFRSESEPEGVDLESNDQRVSTAAAAPSVDRELTQERKFSVTVSELKRILSQSIKTAQAELKKQIALESRILRTARSSSVNPQIIVPRHLHSMSENRHHPGEQIMNHIMPATPPSESATARLLQTNRMYCQKFKVSRQLYLFLRDCLPADARFLLDCQLYTRSLFTSIFADSETEFGDILHLEHQQWKLRVRVKFLLAFIYCAVFVFMLSYFLLFLSSCVTENKLQKLSAVLASLGLWIIFSGFVIQPLVTIFSQYVIPQLICRDVHAARRCCLKTFKDHYLHQVVKVAFDREVKSLYATPPPAAQAKTPATCFSQLLLSSQRFSSEYSESLESSLIEKYRPLSSLAYPLLHMYIPQPYSSAMMKLLLDAEQLEISAQTLEFVCPSLKAYCLSQRTPLSSEVLQEKVDDDDMSSAHQIPITAAPSRSSHFGQEHLDSSCRQLLNSQRVLKEKLLLERFESKHRLSRLLSLRYLISTLLRWHYDVGQHAIIFGPKSPLLISFAGVGLLFQFFLLVLLISLVQLHEVLFFLYPLLALAPIVVFGWMCVVYYFLLHTAHRHTRERRGVCICSDRQVLTHVTIASSLLQCGCDDCQYLLSFGTETECDYCQLRNPKAFSFSRNVLDRLLHPAPSSPPQAPHIVTHIAQQLLSRDSLSDGSPLSPNRQIHSLPSPSSHSDVSDKDIRSADYTSSPSALHQLSPHEDSRYSDEMSSSLESSEDFGEIVIRVPGKKDLSLSAREGIDHEAHIREWVQDLHHEWSETDNIDVPPVPPVPSRKQSLHEPVISRSSNESEHTALSGTISPAMLNLFSEESYDSEFCSKSPSGSFDLQTNTLASPSDGNRNPSIDSYLKALEMRDSYQSERMSQYQDRLLQKSVAKINLKNRRAKSRGGDSGAEESNQTVAKDDERGSDEPRSSSRGGTELTLMALKNRLSKTSTETPSSDASSPRPVDESKESLVRSRVAKSEFESHIVSLHESIEKEKFRSQELLSKRLQEKKRGGGTPAPAGEDRLPFQETSEDML
jgi:hypothetical protein